jgi:hypothetical protein
MTTRPDPNTPEAPQEATGGRQGASEGPSGQREAPGGQNDAQAGAQSLDGEQRPRGPVDWARQQAAEREASGRPSALTITQQQLDALYADLDRYEEVQGEMNERAIDLTRRAARAEAAIERVRVLCSPEQNTDQLGYLRRSRDVLAALDEPPAAKAADGCTAACDGVTGIRGLLEHVGIDTTGRDITVAGRTVDAAPAHNAGPSVAECAQADRLWPLQKEGE